MQGDMSTFPHPVQALRTSAKSPSHPVCRSTRIDYFLSAKCPDSEALSEMPGYNQLMQVLSADAFLELTPGLQPFMANRTYWARQFYNFLTVPNAEGQVVLGTLAAIDFLTGASL